MSGKTERLLVLLESLPETLSSEGEIELCLDRWFIQQEMRKSMLVVQEVLGEASRIVLTRAPQMRWTVELVSRMQDLSNEEIAEYEKRPEFGEGSPPFAFFYTAIAAGLGCAESVNAGAYVRRQFAQAVLIAAEGVVDAGWALRYPHEFHAWLEQDRKWEEYDRAGQVGDPPASEATTPEATTPIDAVCRD